MKPTLSTVVVVLIALTVALVGVVDAATSDEWDTAAIFGLLAAVQLGLLGRISGARPAVPVRGDLVRWLRTRSAVTGEPVEALADRALAAYRDQYGDGPSRTRERTRPDEASHR